MTTHPFTKCVCINKAEQLPITGASSMHQLRLRAVIASLGVLFISHDLFADVPKPPKEEEKASTAPIKATYLVSGLHCPPCTRTLETSLKSLKGVRSAKVDWNTKNAKIEFDETIISAQQLSESIARTPHMMGGNMQYAGWR
jgi:copper chaperone CopZ